MCTGGGLGLCRNDQAKRCMHWPVGDYFIAQRPSAPSVSLALRSHELEEDLCSGGPFIESLACRFQSSKHVYLLVEAMGLSSHPSLCTLMRAHGALRRKDVAAALYHCDLGSRFLSHTAVTKQMDKRRIAAKKLAGDCGATPSLLIRRPVPLMGICA